MVRFHKRVDEVVEQTIQGHGVKVACAKGCSCSLRVEVAPHEAFALADWLKRHLSPDRLSALVAKLRANVERTRAIGTGQTIRSRAPIPRRSRTTHR